jgi:hypothetical protein
MPMFSAPNMNAISIEHVVNVVMKHSILEAKSELHGFASRRSSWHKAKGIGKRRDWRDTNPGFRSDRSMSLRHSRAGGNPGSIDHTVFWILTPDSLPYALCLKP